MEGSFLLPALVLVPLIGAIITLFMGGKRQKYAKYTAFVTTLVILAIAVVLLLADDLSAYDFSANWIDTAGVKMNLIFRVDGLSILMVFLTSVLVPLALVFSYKEGDRPNYFYTLLLAIEFGLLGVYTSADYFLFYIMWEVTLIPFYFLISWYGGPRRHHAEIGRAHV